jgi:predicted RNA methylase
MGLDNRKILVLVGQIFVTLAMMIYYSIACIVKLFVPYTSRCKSIKGETALITGAGSGLGKSLSKKLAKLGTRVVCVDIDTKANEQTVKEVKEAGGDAFAFTCDLSKKEIIYQVADQVRYFLLVNLQPFFAHNLMF